MNITEVHNWHSYTWDITSIIHAILTLFYSSDTVGRWFEMYFIWKHFRSLKTKQFSQLWWSTLLFYYNLNLHTISCENSVNNLILSCPDGTNTTQRNVISFWNQRNIEITEQYCKTLTICVTLLSQGHYPAYIHETLFSQFATFIFFTFLALEITSKDFF